MDESGVSGEVGIGGAGSVRVKGGESHPYALMTESSDARY
jgi:hypothetical protein